MADNVVINPMVGADPNAEKVAAHNAAIAQKLAAQDAAGQSTVSPDTLDTSAALDALAAKVPEKKVEVEPVVTPDPNADKAAADKAVADKAAADKAAADKAAAEEPLKKKAEDIFKDVPGLPAGASPKSSEAFATIKVRAAQEISAREQEIEKLKTQLTELEKNNKQASPEQLAKEKELEDLRTWRTRLDIDFDPKFKEFDKNVSAAQEFIYAQLGKHAAVITPEVIADIKKYGGPENINLTKIFEAIKDPATQRIVESKVADIEMLKYQREQAVKAAKDNVKEWSAKRQEEWSKATTAHTEATTANLTPMLNSFEWLKDQPVDSKAEPAAKTAAEEHNKFAGEVRGQLAEAMKDDSPQMRAILLAGYAQLCHVQRAHAAMTAELAATKKSLEEATAKLERVKSASVSRVKESNAPASGALPGAKPVNLFTTSAADALDALARQVAEARQAKGQ